jgi:hypothetical protein
MSRSAVVDALSHTGLTREHIRRILAGSRKTPPAFRDHLADALDLARLGLSAADLDLDSAQFEQKLERDAMPSLAHLLDEGCDGTRLELKPSPKATPLYRHFGGPKLAPPAGVAAHQPHMLLFHRSPDLTGTDGFLLLLSFGLKDQKWQLVSSVADRPHSPDTLTQWSALSSQVLLTAPLLLGEFILYAVGSPRAYPPAIASLYQNLVGTDAFLTPRQLLKVVEALRFALNHGAWTASLRYVTQ